MPYHGSVSFCPSIHNPSSVPPSVGTNIRQVVSAAVESKIKAVGCSDFTSDGFCLSSLFSGVAELITVYTVTEKEP